MSSSLRFALWIAIPALLLLPGAWAWLPEPRHLAPRAVQILFLTSLLLVGETRVHSPARILFDALAVLAPATLVLPVLCSAAVLDAQLEGIAPLLTLAICWGVFCLAVRGCRGVRRGGWYLVAGAALVWPALAGLFVAPAPGRAGAGLEALSPWQAVWRAERGDFPIAACTLTLVLAALVWLESSRRAGAPS